jgi:hypothetical protein
MYPKRISALLMLTAALILGCEQQPAAPVVPTATEGATSAPAVRTLTVVPIDDSPRIAEDSLQAVEQKHSCRLPDDYRKFLLENNGAFPSPDCVNFEEAGQKTASDVFCFFAIGEQRAWASMEWHRDTYSGRLPENTLPIARDSCGNLWLLSVGGDAGSVYFWDHGSYDTFDETELRNWPRVATSFTEFLGSLDSDDTSAETTVVPSRYSLVKQATGGMAKNNAGFSTRANPGYVWHCDCDDEGNVTMEFVQYEVHAAVTHTDGYSRLRAMKGLIKEGPARLPE